MAGDLDPHALEALLLEIRALARRRGFTVARWELARGRTGGRQRRA